MMHLYLRDTDDWERYLRLLANFEGREAEINARASLIVQERMAGGLGQDEAARLALDDVAAVYIALRAREEAAQARTEETAQNRAARGPRVATPESSRREPDHGPPYRLYTALGIGLAAGLLIGVLFTREGGVEVDPPRTYRGAFTWDSGTVALWGDALVGASLRERIGQGVSPSVQVRPGRLRVHWVAPAGVEGVSAMAWLVDTRGAAHALSGGGAYTSLSEPVEFSVTDKTMALVVVAYPTEDDPGAIVQVAGDGRSAVGGAGVWQMIAFRFVEGEP